MNHERARLLLHGYVDGELDLVSALEMEEHIRGCERCAQAYQSHQALRSALGQPSLYFRPPPGLEKRVRASVRTANKPASRWTGLPRGWVALAAAVVVLLLIGSAAWLGWPTVAPNNQLADEVLSSHIRSMMGTHLTDVASTDQHTVKPWFDGKLSFSPEVQDLASEGYPLVGGRIDYLDNHPVAALVYKRRLHVINVFTWPTTEPDSEVQESAQQGYNLLRWNHAGMTYWTVSDLNTSELAQFVQLLQHPPAPTATP